MSKQTATLGNSSESLKLMLNFVDVIVFALVKMGIDDVVVPLLKLGVFIVR